MPIAIYGMSCITAWTGKKFPVIVSYIEQSYLILAIATNYPNSCVPIQFAMR